MPIYASIEKAWNRVLQNVRAGRGQLCYPVGTILYDNFNSETGTAFEVVGHNHHFDPSLTERGFTNSMTLCQLKLDYYQFSAQDAFLYLETPMPAGRYRITLPPNYDTSYGGGLTYYFDTTKTIPVGGQITLLWNSNTLPSSISTYESQSSTTALDSAKPLTVWDSSIEATDLGIIKYGTYMNESPFGKLNQIRRVRYGSNNYAQSGIRQILNTSALANTWYEPQTIFNRPYGNRSSNGYLSLLNQHFIDVLAKPSIINITNNDFEYESINGTQYQLNTKYNIDTDKIFLLSHTEVGLSASPTLGNTLQYYSGATNSKRIKYRKSNNQATTWWLRPPYPSYAYGVRGVYSSGALSYSNAYGSQGSAAACVIQ